MLNQDSPPPITPGALRQAIRDVLYDPEFMQSLAEKVADALDGFDDKAMLESFQAANNGELASEEEIFTALKDK